MKMHIGFVLLLAVAALANTMQAQEPDNSLQMKIDSLNEVIKKQDVSIKVKTKELEGNASIKSLQDDCKKRSHLVEDCSVCQKNVVYCVKVSKYTNRAGKGA